MVATSKKTARPTPPKMPPAPPIGDDEDAEERNAFEQAKTDTRNELAHKDLKWLVHQQAEALVARDAAKKELAKANARYDVIRMELVPAKMDEEGIDTITYPDMGRVSLTADLLVSVKKGAKEGLYAWLRKAKLADIISPSINSSTLKAFVKNRMKAGKVVPSVHLNVTPITRASITPPK